MKHTNAQRGADGKFGAADGPKAKRIEVWLQPTTVELLDTLCRQWNVGRGKVIDQLITRGPVAPAAWLEVEGQVQPTPSARAASAPKAPPSTSPPAGLTAFGDLEDELQEAAAPPTKPEWQLLREHRDRCRDDAELAQCKPLQVQAFKERHQLPTDRHLSADELELLRQELAPKPEPTPAEPTNSGPVDFNRFRDPDWEIHQADAKAIGIKGFTADKVRSFKGRHKLPMGQRLTMAAVELLEQEQEAASRAAVGDQRAQQVALQAINARLTANVKLAEQIADHCCSVELSDGKTATNYLLDELPALGFKPYRKLCKGLWDLLHKQFPEAGLLDLRLDEVPPRRALFWGVVLRLHHLADEMPTTSDRLLDWCQFTVHADHQGRRSAANGIGAMADWMAGRLTEEEARAALGLPDAGTELTRKAINDAYRQRSRDHHPDAGGDPAQFQRITAARDRLLMTVQS